MSQMRQDARDQGDSLRWLYLLCGHVLVARSDSTLDLRLFVEILIFSASSGEWKFECIIAWRKSLCGA